MRAYEFIVEGGWEDTITQKTKLTPAVVKQALGITKTFVDAFNKWLEKKGQPPIKMGHPTGSSAYHKVDDPDTEYGDIDLQMIAPELEGKTPAQLASHYNKLMDEFISQAKLPYVYDKGKPANGHPIFNLEDAYVQVDFLWMPERTADWGRYRVTPMRGIKGLITGNLYSTLGEITNMSLQSSVLMKIKDGEPVNYQKSRKVDKVVEISKNIGTFGIDILEFIYKAVHGDSKGLKVDKLLQQHPGINRDDIQISDLVKMIKGLANSFEMNDLYGKFNLKDFSSKEDFLDKFMQHYLDKADKAGHGAKLDKATTPEELAKVQELRDKIAKGVKVVQQAFDAA